MKLRLIGGGAIVALLIWLLVLAFRIVDAGKLQPTASADVAIVLGAAAYGDRPSPVFEERIRHGIALYKAGKVRKLLFTGGRGDGAVAAESVVGRDYALRLGVPADAILIETKSRTTKQNLTEARRLMRAHRIGSALIVTDPLHAKRALKMSADLGITAYSSPTATSRYRTWRSKSGFLLREIYFYNVYLLSGQ